MKKSCSLHRLLALSMLDFGASYNGRNWRNITWTNQQKVSEVTTSIVSDEIHNKTKISSIFSSYE